MFTQNIPLILGSSSPRRIAFLQEYELNLTIIKPEIDEEVHLHEKVDGFVKRMVEEKGKAVKQIALTKGLDKHCIITADTVVLLGDEIIGKPKNEKFVLPLLQKLNGKEHEVVSAYAIQFTNKKETYITTVKTKVQFRNNQPMLLEKYAMTKEPLDKAGAYSIQGMGRMFVKSITGSYTNVIGLPIESLLEELLMLKIIRI